MQTFGPIEKLWLAVAFLFVAVMYLFASQYAN